MKKQLADEVIRNLQENPSFQAFQAYCISKVQELKTNGENVKTLDDLRVGQNAKAGYLAAEKLIEIFSPIVNFIESTKPTKEDIKKREEELGL